MKKLLFLMPLQLIWLIVSCQSAKNNPEPKVDLTNEDDKFSYAIGVNIAESFEQQGLNEPLNVDAFIKGIKDQMADTSLIAKDSIKPIIQNRMMKIMEEKSAKKTTENKKFFSKNAQREEVKELESGLQYEVIKEGTGPKPTPKDQIMAHYHGTTLEGKVFDSSVERGEPATFPVSGVIKGWQEILPMMPVGSKYKIYVPSDLAYGQRGAGQDIGPNEALIFEIELLKIVE